MSRVATTTSCDQTEPIEIWYRFEEQTYAAPLDEFDGGPCGEGLVEVHLHKYEVIRHTPKGVWVKRRIGAWSCGHARFILRQAHKRYACPTMEEAGQSFLARKARQARIFKARLRTIEKALAVFEHMRIEMEIPA